MALPKHAETHPLLDDPDGTNCFGCKAASIDLTFRYGRENFHNETIGEFARREFAIAEARGEPKPEPIGTRWV